MGTRKSAPERKKKVRYVALLRGVSPMNASMPALTRALTEAGFENVRTVLTSGNVLFDAERAADRTVARKIEAAMEARLERSFPTIVRTVEHLRRLIASDPFASHPLDSKAKRVVTFLRAAPTDEPVLPVVRGETQLVRRVGLEVLSASVGETNGSALMRSIEKTFGKELTTRTWETVAKLAR